MLRIRVALCALLALTALAPDVLAEEPMLTSLDNATLQEIVARHTGEGALVFTESRSGNEYLAGNSRFRKRCEILRAAAKR